MLKRSNFYKSSFAFLGFILLALFQNFSSGPKDASQDAEIFNRLLEPQRETEIVRKSALLKLCTDVDCKASSFFPAEILILARSHGGLVSSFRVRVMSETNWPQINPPLGPSVNPADGDYRRGINFIPNMSESFSYELNSSNPWNYAREATRSQIVSAESGSEIISLEKTSRSVDYVFKPGRSRMPSRSNAVRLKVGSGLFEADKKTPLKLDVSLRSFGQLFLGTSDENDKGRLLIRCASEQLDLTVQQFNAPFMSGSETLVKSFPIGRCTDGLIAFTRPVQDTGSIYRIQASYNSRLLNLKELLLETRMIYGSSGLDHNYTNLTGWRLFDPSAVVNQNKKNRVMFGERAGIINGFLVNDDLKPYHGEPDQFYSPTQAVGSYGGAYGWSSEFFRFANAAFLPEKFFGLAQGGHTIDQKLYFLDTTNRKAIFIDQDVVIGTFDGKCYIKTDNKVFCVDDPANPKPRFLEQISPKLVNPRLNPTAGLPGVAGNYTYCGINENRDLYCSGLLDKEQVFQGTNSIETKVRYSFEPVLVLKNVLMAWFRSPNSIDVEAITTDGAVQTNAYAPTPSFNGGTTITKQGFLGGFKSYRSLPVPKAPVLVADAASPLTGSESPSRILVWQNMDSRLPWYWNLNDVTHVGTDAALGDAQPGWTLVGSMPNPSRPGSSYLIWQNDTTGQPWYWTMDGTKHVGPDGPLGPNVPDWRLVGSMPVPGGNGNYYLIWQHKTSRLPWYWEMNGANYTGRYGALGDAQPGWSLVGSMPNPARPGHSYLLWQNDATGQPWYWTMDGTKHMGPDGPLGPNAPGWRLVGSMPILGDGGNSYLLWQNVANGTPVNWKMSGVNKVGDQTMGPPVSGWKLVGILPASDSARSPAATAPARAPASCVFAGVTIPDGGSVNAYPKAILPAGATCPAAQKRLCRDGFLDNDTLTSLTCSVSPPNRPNTPPR